MDPLSLQNALKQHSVISKRTDINQIRRNSAATVVFNTFDNASHLTTATHKNNNFSMEPKLKNIIIGTKEPEDELIRYSNMLVLPPIESQNKNFIPVKKKRTSVLQIISKN